MEIARDLRIQQIQAERAAEQKDAELQKGVEASRALMELERLRASTVTKAKIARESAQEKADADLYSHTKRADGEQYEQRAEAEAQYYRREKEADAMLMAKEKEAEANYLVRTREAEAHFIAQQKEAQGLTEMAKAYGAMAEVLGGPQGLMQYLMLQNNTYEKLANANANAIRGLNPKINVWNTGNQEAGSADASAPIRNLFQSLPPLLSTIQDQTGMQPPAWLARMPEQNGEGKNGEMGAETKAALKRQMLNGNGINGVTG